MNLIGIYWDDMISIRRNLVNQRKKKMKGRERKNWKILFYDNSNEFYLYSSSIFFVWVVSGSNVVRGACERQERGEREWE